MPPFPEDKIDEVRQAADIVEVIGRYVELKQQGRLFKGLCPFHAEKTPSFTVNPERRIFKCFGCGEGGNVFTFLMKHAGMTFPEAVRDLARSYHIELPRPKATPEETRRLKAREGVLAVCRQAAEFYAANLSSQRGVEARTYLKKRGIPAEVVERYGLGWIDDRWDGLINEMRRRGVSPARVAEAGLAVPRKGGGGYYDRFRGRLMIPIRDGRGRVVAFGGRALTDEVEPKYLNSPETSVFKKGRLLYGLYEARDAVRRARRVVVVEGYFDCLALASAGLEYAVATMGTALTDRQIGQLRGLHAEVILVYDADEAGLKAALRAQELFTKHEVSAKILSLPEGQDPDDFVRANGLAAFEALLENAQPMVAFAVDRLLDRPLSTPEDKGAALKDLAPVLGRIALPVEQAAYVQIVAARLGVDQAAVMAGLTRGGRKADLARRLVGRRDKGDRDQGFVAALINDPDCCRALMEAGLDEVLRDPVCKRVAEAAFRASRAGEPLDAAALMDRLDAEGAELVARLVWEDGRRPTPEYRAEMLAALERLKRKLTVQDIVDQIAAAEAAGDEDKVMRLLALRRALDR